MRILSVLPADSHDALQRAVGTTHETIAETRTSQLRAVLRQHACDMVILDPAVVDDKHFLAVLNLISEARVPVLLYCRLTPEVASRVVRFAADAPHELLVRGSEDEPTLLRHTIAKLLEPSVSAHVLNRAASRFARFPAPLQIATVALFANRAPPRWVDAFTETSQLGRRTIDRWMQRTGLSGTGKLLDVARLARVWEPLVERNLALHDVARLTGYREQRLLISHTLRLVGVVPNKLGSALSREEFAKRLTAVLLSGRA